MSIRLALKLFAAAVCAAACSHTAARPVGNEAAQTPQGNPEPQAPAAAALPQVFVPGVASAQTYGGQPTPPLNNDPLVRALRQALLNRARDLGFAAPVSDGRMDLAASQLATWQGPLTHDLLNFICHHVGLAEPQPAVTAVRTNQPDDAIVRAVVQHSEEALSHSAWARLGIGVSRERGEVGVVVLLGSVAVELAPVPRAVQGAGVAAIKGRVPLGYTQTQVAVTTPGGRAGRLPIAVKGGEFSSEFRCVAGAGRYDVEVLASGPRGPEVLVNVPVYCDEPPPTQFEPRAQTEFGDVSTPAAVEQAILAAINRERQQRGVAPVASDVRLVQLARAHSRDMATQRTISHLSSRGEDAQVRVMAAGLSPQLVAENVGTATTASAVHEGFMGSPGHRSNVLDPRATHVGVGAVEGIAPNGLVVWYVTELYAGFAAKKR